MQKKGKHFLEKQYSKRMLLFWLLIFIGVLADKLGRKPLLLFSGIKHTFICHNSSAMGQDFFNKQYDHTDRAEHSQFYPFIPDLSVWLILKKDNSSKIW